MRISARDLGGDASQVIDSGGTGKVAAVFERSAYIEFTSGWVCLGSREIGSGPLNIPCSTPSGTDWRELARTGTLAWPREGVLCLSATCKVEIADAPIWRPLPHDCHDQHQLMVTLERLGEFLPAELPSGGLAGLLDPGRTERSLVLEVAGPAVRDFEAWLTGPAETQLRILDGSVRNLLGLGPGLTPSGDDFMAGAMAALRGFGRNELATAVWRAIEGVGSEATTSISYAHMLSAARGALGEDLHALLGAILGGRTSALYRMMQTMKAKRNHSPWDGLAGICIALRGLCRGPSPAARI